MIRSATLDEIPGYRGPLRQRSKRDRRPEHRRAMWIGGGSISIPGDPLIVAFNGNFASLFPGAYQSLQADLGLTYGGVPLANAGNTATTVLSLTGALPTVPVPIWARATNSLAIGAGATFSIYYDGTGTTPAMIGVNPAVGVPVALTGAATGLSVAWAAGTSVNGNTWKATCAALADQTPNAKNMSQAIAAKQPVVGLDASNNLELQFDGVDDELNGLLTLPAPGTTPWAMFGVVRHDTWAASDVLISPSVGTGLYSNGVTPQVTLFNGSGAANNGGAPLMAWVDYEAMLQNTAADSLKLGVTTTVGITFGNAINNGTSSIGALSGVRFAKMGFRASVYAAGVAQDWPAIRAAVAAKYGTGNVIA